MENKGWIGVDLDGTLAHWEKWDDDVIGEPIPAMADRVKEWLTKGQRVKIFTARVSTNDEKSRKQELLIQNWTEKYFGARLEVTATKDRSMIQLWDDRAVGVEHNTGEIMPKTDMSCFAGWAHGIMRTEPIGYGEILPGFELLRTTLSWKDPLGVPGYLEAGTYVLLREDGFAHCLKGLVIPKKCPTNSSSIPKWEDLTSLSGISSDYLAFVSQANHLETLLVSETYNGWLLYSKALLVGYREEDNPWFASWFLSRMAEFVESSSLEK